MIITPHGGSTRRGPVNQGGRWQPHRATFYPAAVSRPRRAALSRRFDPAPRLSSSTRCAATPRRSSVTAGAICASALSTSTVASTSPPRRLRQSGRRVIRSRGPIGTDADTSTRHRPSACARTTPRRGRRSRYALRCQRSCARRRVQPRWRGLTGRHGGDWTSALVPRLDAWVQSSSVAADGLLPSANESSAAAMWFRRQGTS